MSLLYYVFDLANEAFSAIFMCVLYWCFVLCFLKQTFDLSRTILSCTYTVCNSNFLAHSCIFSNILCEMHSINRVQSDLTK